MENTVREVYNFSNNKIFKEGNRKPLKFKKLEGCHNNYEVMLPNGVKAFLKEGYGCTDYADVISKRICDAVGIECAECELAIMQDFPSEKEISLMSFDEHSQFCEKNFGITDKTKLEESYFHYLEQYRQEKYKPALLSYDYCYREPYKSSQIINLDKLVTKYCDMTNTENTFAIESFVKIAEIFTDKNNKLGKKLRKELKVKDNIELSPNFDLELKKIAVLGYVTCQTDMTRNNLHLALVKNKKGYELQVAPLFDNGESFNLSSIERNKELSSYDVDQINSTSVSYGNSLVLTEGEGKDAEKQVESIAREIIKNPELSNFFNKLQNLDIADMCEKENIGERDFDIIKYSVVSIYNQRVNSLTNEIQKQISNDIEYTDTYEETMNINQDEFTF